MKKENLKMKKELSNLEIFGAEAIFNNSLEDYCDLQGLNFVREELFYCGSILNSTSNANGQSIYIEDYEFSHCEVNENHVVFAICFDEDENEVIFRCENNEGFRKLDC